MSQREVVKSLSQLQQKEMISRNYDRITGGECKVSSTFVPGNLNELLMCFDIANNLPEINAIQNAMRKKSGDMITEAERAAPAGSAVDWAAARESPGPDTAASSHRPPALLHSKCRRSRT